jgi:hypothetical protein
VTTQDSHLVVVHAYSQPHEAHLAQSALEAAGIRSTLADDHIVATNWLWSNAVGGVKVLVSSRDLTAAQAVLAVPADVDEGAIPGTSQGPADETSCPRCGSRDLRPFTAGRRLSVLSWILAGLPLFPVRRRMRCEGCGKQFRLPPSSAR